MSWQVGPAWCRCCSPPVFLYHNQEVDYRNVQRLLHGIVPYLLWMIAYIDLIALDIRHTFYTNTYAIFCSGLLLASTSTVQSRYIAIYTRNHYFNAVRPIFQHDSLDAFPIPSIRLLNFQKFPCLNKKKEKTRHHFIVMSSELLIKHLFMLNFCYTRCVIFYL